MACDGVPGHALAVQNHSRFYDTGVSEKVSQVFSFRCFPLGQLIFMDVYSVYPTFKTKRSLVLRGE